MKDDLTLLMEARVAAAAAANPRPRPVLASNPEALTEAMEVRAELLAEAGNDATTWADIRRICELPVRSPLSKEEAEELSRMYVLESAFRRGFRLWPLQAQAINDYDIERGLLGPIPVGHGKSTISSCIAHLSYVSGRRKSMLLMPPETVDTYRHALPVIRIRVPLACPMHFVEGDRETRSAIYNSRQAGCYVVPISLLSVEDSEEMLYAIDPGTITVDEVHKMKNHHAARTQRLERYIESHPLVEFCGLSGTITNRRLEDYAHLARWALGSGAPVPMNVRLTYMLGQVLDSDAQPGPDMLKRWEAIRRWARTWYPAEDLTFDVIGMRRSFQLRLCSAPGVVSGSGENLCDTRLVIRNGKRQSERLAAARDQRGFAEITRMMKDVENKYVAPNGDQIAHAIHTHKWLRELTAGFYNLLQWPEAKVVARRKGISTEDAREMLRRALEHHLLKQEYNVELRKWLSRHRIPKLDTPNLVGLSMHRNGDKFVGKEPFACWKAMKALEFEDMPEREGQPVRVCDYKVREALSWSDQHRDGGILWVYSIEMGKWVYEALRAAGFSQAVHCPAGENDLVNDTANRDKLLVCSITSHGTGKELQHHQNQFFVEWPRSALAVEQVLGRLQRPGQTADEIAADTCDTTPYDAYSRAAGLIDALYQGQTSGSPQRAIFAQYDPLPEVFPPEVLRERGFENEMLDEHLKAAMLDKFRNHDRWPKSSAS